MLNFFDKNLDNLLIINTIIVVIEFIVWIGVLVG